MSGDMLDFLEHHIASYWRKAAGRSWADAWLFMRKHVFWDIAIIVAALVILAILRLPEFWHEVVLGLVLMLSAVFLIWLWHLFIVTPARIHRDDKLALEKARADTAQQQEARAKAETEAADLRILLAETQEARAKVESDLASLRESVVKVEAPTARVLQVEGFIDNLRYAYPPEWMQANPTEDLHAIFQARAFACLRVRNVGHSNISSLVARCLIGEDEIPCLWSQAVGNKFALGGGVSEDLPVEHDRVLVIAQGFGKEQVWTRLPHEQRHFFRVDLPTKSGRSDVDKVLGRHADPVIALEPGSDGEPVLAVRFRASGCEQVERFRLGFDPELIADAQAGLVISPAPPSAAPAQSTASSQSPPSSPESSGSPSASK